MKKIVETVPTCLVAREDGAGAAAETAVQTVQAAKKRRGRPLSFDRNAALEVAMQVFWERGYEATSISDLTSAMGITPPSLYTAFGDKERLFLETIERYALNFGSAGVRALAQEPTARSAIERWLTEAANELTRPSHPKGCMVVMAATNCTAAAQRVQDALLLRRTEAIANVGRRIQSGVDDGELSADTRAGDLANFYATIYQGMSMQARDGATHASLLVTVRTAMCCWPQRGSAPRRGVGGGRGKGKLS